MQRWLTTGIVAGLVLLGSTIAQAWEPLGYPYLAWGELSRDVLGDRGEGVTFDTRLEQGMTVLGFGAHNAWRVTPFVGLRVTLSDQSRETWNNKIGPDFGVKLTHNVPVSPGHWAQVSVGIKGEHFTYFAEDRPSELRGVVFIQYGFGGAWGIR